MNDQEGALALAGASHMEDGMIRVSHLANELRLQDWQVVETARGLGLPIGEMADLTHAFLTVQAVTPEVAEVVRASLARSEGQRQARAAHAHEKNAEQAPTVKPRVKRGRR